MNEDQKKVLILFLASLALCIVAFWLWSRSIQHRTEQDCSNVTKSVERAEEALSRSGDRLDESQRKIEESESELDRAAARTGEAIDRAKDSEKIIDDSKAIIERSEDRAERISKIIDDVERGNKKDGT